MRDCELRQAPSPLLSHLDLMTCGLGGGLVLLFVVLAVQRTAGVIDLGMSPPHVQSDSMSPFVIVAYGDQGQPIVGDAVDASPWQFTGLSADFGEAVNAGEFVLFHASTPPPPEARIELATLMRGQRISVAVFHLGRRRTWSFDPAKVPQQVWPLPMEGSP